MQSHRASSSPTRDVNLPTVNSSYNTTPKLHLKARRLPINQYSFKVNAYQTGKVGVVLKEFAFHQRNWVRFSTRRSMCQG